MFGAKRLLFVKEGYSVAEVERPEVLGVSRVAVVGCGESGCRTLRRIIERTPKYVETVAIANKRQLKKTKADRNIRLEKALFRQNMPEACYANAIRSLKEGLVPHLDNFDVVFVTAHAAHELDTSMASVALDAAKEQGATAVAFVTLPSEGLKMELAKKEIEQLRESADAVVVLDEGRIFENVPDVPLPRHRLASAIAADVIKAISETLFLVNPHYKLTKELLKGLCVPFLKFGLTKTEIYVSQQDLLLKARSDAAAGAIVTLTFMFSVGMGLTVEEFNEVIERMMFDALKGTQNAIIDARAGNEPLGSYVAKLVGVLTGLRWECLEAY